jgi:hypothetical protein
LNIRPPREVFMVSKGVRTVLCLLTCLLVAERFLPRLAGPRSWWVYAPIRRIEPSLLAVARPSEERTDLSGAYRSLAIGELARAAATDRVPMLTVPESLFLLTGTEDVASFDNLTPALLTMFAGGRLDPRPYDPVLPDDVVARLPPLRRHEPFVATLADGPHPGPLALVTDSARRWIYILPDRMVAEWLREER